MNASSLMIRRNSVSGDTVADMYHTRTRDRGDPRPVHPIATATRSPRPSTRPTDPTFPRAEDTCLISWTLELSANYGSFLEANI